MSDERLSPQEEAELQRRMEADPRYAQILQQSNYRYRGTQMTQLARDTLRAMGYPHETVEQYMASTSGQSGYNERRPAWQIAAMLAVPATLGTIGLAAGGGAAAGAGGGGAAAGGAGLANPLIGGAIPGLASTALGTFPAAAGPLIGGSVPGVATTALEKFPKSGPSTLGRLFGGNYGPLLLGAGAQGLLNFFGARQLAKASEKAAETQARSAERAMQLQAQLAQQALGLQGTMWEGIRGLYNPYVSTAPATLGALHAFLDIPGAAAAQTSVPAGAYTHTPFNMGGAGGRQGTINPVYPGPTYPSTQPPVTPPYPPLPLPGGARRRYPY